MPRPRTSTAFVALAIVALAGAYGLGSRRAATETTVTARETAAEPSAEVMDEAAFWRLVTDTRAASGDDTGRQSELLDARLPPAPRGADRGLRAHPPRSRPTRLHLGRNGV